MWRSKTQDLLRSSFSRFRTFTSETTTSASQQAPEQVKNTNTLVKAVFTAGSLSLMGDVLAQGITIRNQESIAGRGPNYDVWRSARMCGFGLVLLGPIQHNWYGALHRQWPSASMKNLVTKVGLNQVVLGPILISSAFAWNLALTNQANQIGDKLKREFWPTLVNAWKFWLPAASINFTVIPLRHQVLYMSFCSMLWTAYLSHIANTRRSTRVSPA